MAGFNGCLPRMERCVRGSFSKFAQRAPAFASRFPRVQFRILRQCALWLPEPFPKCVRGECGGAWRAHRVPHGALQRYKKEGAHAQIENENDGDGGQSLNDQVNELVEDFHFQQTAALRSSWIWRLIERRMRSGHKKAFAKLDIIASAVSGVNAEIAMEMTAKIASEIARWLPGLLTRHGAAC